jgi:hypothetical protein
MLVGKIPRLYADETLYGLALMNLTIPATSPKVPVAFRG